MFDRATLHCENLPVTIIGETIYVDRMNKEITSVDLLNCLQKVLNDHIEDIRGDGSPLEKVADCWFSKTSCSRRISIALTR